MLQGEYAEPGLQNSTTAEQVKTTGSSVSKAGVLSAVLRGVPPHEAPYLPYPPKSMSNPNGSSFRKWSVAI